MNTDYLVTFSQITRCVITSFNRKAGTCPVESKAGSVGYAQCSERILTFSNSMARAYPTHTG